MRQCPISLTEILEEKGRALYLRTDAPKTAYHEYKLRSTLYRVAALLGWIQAYRRERSFLDPVEAVRDDPIEESVVNLEAALADGPHVEDKRLLELIRIWDIPVDDSLASGRGRQLAIAIENKLKTHLPLLSPDGVPAERLESTAKAIADQIFDSIGQPGTSRQINLLSDEARRILGTKEAWIYRDWQAGIGNMMLVEGARGRRFDVRSYDDFEQMIVEAAEAAQPGSERSRRWLSRIESVFIDLDPDETKGFDARPGQVRAFAKAVAKLEAEIRNRIASYEHGS